MKGNSATATPEAWKMRFLASEASSTWFYTDDITVADTWLCAHPDDMGIIPLCRMPPRQHSHEQHIEEPHATLVQMLHMHHMMLETTHYRENITDTRYIREIHEAPLQAFNILARRPHKKDEV